MSSRLGSTDQQVRVRLARFALAMLRYSHHAVQTRREDTQRSVATSIYADWMLELVAHELHLRSWYAADNGSQMT
jgi:hypothetical protein